MNITLYKTTERHTFLVLPEEATPPPHVQLFGPAIKTMNLERGKVLIGADTDGVLDDIERQGWAVFKASVAITVH